MTVSAGSDLKAGLVMACDGARPPFLLAWEHKFINSMQNVTFNDTDSDINDSKLPKYFWIDVPL